MKLFKKKTKPPDRAKERIRDRFANTALKIQGRWAAYMNRVAVGWSPFQKKLALILFCSVMGANSGIALYKGFNTNQHSITIALRPVKIQQINLPKDTLMDHTMRIKMKTLSLVIDSMSKTDSGRAWLDDLKTNRPGLWDSMNRAINYYK